MKGRAPQGAEGSAQRASVLAEKRGLSMTGKGGGQDLGPCESRAASTDLRVLALAPGRHVAGRHNGPADRYSPNNVGADAWRGQPVQLCQQNADSIQRQLCDITALNGALTMGRRGESPRRVFNDSMLLSDFLGFQIFLAIQRATLTPQHHKVRDTLFRSRW